MGRDCIRSLGLRKPQLLPANVSLSPVKLGRSKTKCCEPGKVQGTVEAAAPPLSPWPLSVVLNGSVRLPQDRLPGLRAGQLLVAKENKPETLSPLPVQLTFAANRPMLQAAQKSPRPHPQSPWLHGFLGLATEVVISGQPVDASLPPLGRAKSRAAHLWFRV